jgi:hypothetical protein
MSSVGGLIGGGLLGALETVGPRVLALFIGSELAHQAKRGTRLGFGLLGTLPVFMLLGLIFTGFSVRISVRIGVGLGLFAAFAAIVGVLAGVRAGIE